MANTRDLRRRRRSIINTGKITRAMQMVAATKMRKAQNQAVSARPYISTLCYALSRVCSKINPSLNPLLLENDSEKTAVLVLSSDKGLCGALNTNIFRTITNSLELKDQKEIIFYTQGKKGRDFIVRTHKNLEADFENPDKVDFAQAVSIRKFLMESFLSGKIGQAYLLYPDFISTLRQEPKLIKIFPINTEALLLNTNMQATTATPSAEFLFEPNPQAVLDYALIHLIDTQIYQAILETKASEHSARMITMQNATNSAKDLVEDLTLTYNQARQDSITRELLEIASAGAALEAA